MVKRTHLARIEAYVCLTWSSTPRTSTRRLITNLRQRTELRPQYGRTTAVRGKPRQYCVQELIKVAEFFRTVPFGFPSTRPPTFTVFPSAISCQVGTHAIKPQAASSQSQRHATPRHTPAGCAFGLLQWSGPPRHPRSEVGGRLITVNLNQSICTHYSCLVSIPPQRMHTLQMSLTRSPYLLSGPGLENSAPLLLFPLSLQ